ncbi:unnamed protein product [Boreogadus saida]
MTVRRGAQNNKRLPHGCALQPRQQQRVVRRKVTEPTITWTVAGKESGRIDDEEQQVSLKDPQDGRGRAAGVPVGASGDTGGGDEDNENPF